MAKNNLKKILIKSGIKQSEFARAVNLSVGMVNKVANQRMTPADTTKNKMIKILNEMTKENYTVADVFLDQKK